MEIKTTNMTFSIIIAIFNGEKTIKRCIDSVLNQSYPFKQLIIIDGGSTDNTVSILKEYGNKIDYWESKPDRGIYHAWNKGLDHASGEWICFLGADDYWNNSESLKRFFDFGNFSDVDIIVSSGYRIGQEEKKKKLVGIPWDWEKMKKWQGILHPGMMHRKRLFDQYGKFNDSFRIAGDYDFLLRLGEKVKASFVNEPLICIGDNGVSRSNTAKVFYETWEIQKVHSEIGLFRATYNYLIANTKVIVRRMLCRI